MRSMIPLIFLAGATTGVGLATLDWAIMALGALMGFPAMRIVWEASDER